MDLPLLWLWSAGRSSAACNQAAVRLDREILHVQADDFRTQANAERQQEAVSVSLTGDGVEEQASEHGKQTSALLQPVKATEDSSTGASVQALALDEHVEVLSQPGPIGVQQGQSSTPPADAPSSSQQTAAPVDVSAAVDAEHDNNQVIPTGDHSHSSLLQAPTPAALAAEQGHSTDLAAETTSPSKQLQAQALTGGASPSKQLQAQALTGGASPSKQSQAQHSPNAAHMTVEKQSAAATCCDDAPECSPADDDSVLRDDQCKAGPAGQHSQSMGIASSSAKPQDALAAGTSQSPRALTTRLSHSSGNTHRTGTVHASVIAMEGNNAERPDKENDASSASVPASLAASDSQSKAQELREAEEAKTAAAAAAQVINCAILYMLFDLLKYMPCMHTACSDYCACACHVLSGRHKSFSSSRDHACIPHKRHDCHQAALCMQSSPQTYHCRATNKTHIVLHSYFKSCCKEWAIWELEHAAQCCR